MTTVTYPIELPIHHTGYGDCLLRIASDTAAVLVIDGQEVGPEDLMPGSRRSAIDPGSPAWSGYLHKVDGHEYTTAEQAAIDAYVIATTVAGTLAGRAWRTGDPPLKHHFGGGATINNMAQLAEIEWRLGDRLSLQRLGPR